MLQIWQTYNYYLSSGYMRENSLIEVIISKEELDQLKNDLQGFRETNQLLKEQNERLNSTFSAFSQHMAEQQIQIEEASQLRIQVRNLSKTVLQLGRAALEIKEAKCLVESTETQTEKTENTMDGSVWEEDELLSKTMQQKQQVLDSLHKAEAENRVFQLLLANKESVIEDLHFEIRKLEGSIHPSHSVKQTQIIKDLKLNLSQMEQKKEIVTKADKISMEDAKIIKDWKLTPQHVAKRKEIVAKFQTDNILLLNKTIEQLQNERTEMNYLLLNQRNIIEIFRKQVEDKQIMLGQVRQSYMKKELQLEKMKQEVEAKLKRGKEALDKRYFQKVKSLQEFSTSDQYQKKVKKTEQEKERLRKELKQLSQEGSKKQNVIDYMNNILESIRGPNDISVQKAIDLEVVEFEAQTLMHNREERKKELEVKLSELVRRVEMKVKEIHHENKDQIAK